jgi:ribonuclease HII
MNPLYTADLRLLSEHSTLIGVDEAGRGCLAGPLVCAAVVLDYELIFDKLKDSKQLSPTVREELYRLIIDSCATYSIQVMPVEYIDEHNILNATMEGMRRAILALGITHGTRG